MAFGTDLQRVMRSGLINFWRNGVVSFAAVLSMTLALTAVAFVLFMSAVLQFSIDQIQERVDINIFFLPEAPESSIIALQKQITTYPGVAKIEYVSRDEALESFKERYANDFLTLQALDELGENPLGASLNIKADTPDQYENIAQYLQSDGGLNVSDSSIIEKVNYNQNKKIIDRLTDVVGSVRAVGVIISVILSLVAVLITLNTLRLAIYASRQEIHVMRLVGATNSYIRGPFMVEGMLYGIASAIVTAVILYPITYVISQQTTTFFGGLSLFNYYLSNFAQMIILLLVVGSVMGVISSTIAVRAYLKK
ncbi:MAG: ABC transporter permease [Candidatus Nomurabacteria bacterium]|nr:ABC transporter permease [Candidatus Nomurabacteria bacterium]